MAFFKLTSRAKDQPESGSLAGSISLCDVTAAYQTYQQHGSVDCSRTMVHMDLETCQDSDPTRAFSIVLWFHATWEEVPPALPPLDQREQDAYFQARIMWSVHPWTLLLCQLCSPVSLTRLLSPSSQAAREHPAPASAEDVFPCSPSHSERQGYCHNHLFPLGSLPARGGINSALLL